MNDYRQDGVLLNFRAGNIAYDQIMSSSYPGIGYAWTRLRKAETDKEIGEMKNEKNEKLYLPWGIPVEMNKIQQVRQKLNNIER